MARSSGSITTCRLVFLSVLAAGCRFAPDLSAYTPCNQGTCPAGYRCLLSEQICLADCSGAAGCSPADAGPDAGVPDTEGRDSGPPGSDAGPLDFETDALPEADEGALYLQVLQARGGARPYTFSVASGGLPAGLALTPQGTLSGTPGVAGTSSFAIQVTDATSQVAPGPSRSP